MTSSTVFMEPPLVAVLLGLGKSMCEFGSRRPTQTRNYVEAHPYCFGTCRRGSYLVVSMRALAPCFCLLGIQTSRRCATTLAWLVALLSICTAMRAGDYTLTNDALTLNLRDDNGAIDAVVFNGTDFFKSGTPISNYGFQLGTNTGTFAINDTSG